MPESARYLVFLRRRPAYPGRVGEHNSSVVRAGGAVAVSVAVAIALTSCSLLQVAPSPVATSSAKAVVDPSVPSAAPTPAPSVTDSPAAPDPSATPLPSPTPTPAPSIVPGTTKVAVTPFITLADWDPGSARLQVVAMVPSLVENGGTCTATVTNGTVTRTASAGAAALSGYTGCDPITLAGSALPAGTWTVRLAYSSKTAVGASSAKTVEVTR